MPSTGIIDHEHQLILEEDQAHRLANERRFAMPGCPWGCDNGWHEILFSEFGPLDRIPLPDPAVIVLPHGLILIACDCNSGVGGRVLRFPDWYRM